jgi:hypothetical protein
MGELMTDGSDPSIPSIPSLQKTKDEIEAWLKAEDRETIWIDLQGDSVETIYGIVSRVPLKFLCP